MKFSTKTRYGIRAMLEIALCTTGTGVHQKDIATRQNISVKYLDQIIPVLKSAGLIINVRGKKSGYILTRKASEITMFDIHNAFEPVQIIGCSEHKILCRKFENCVARNFWCGLNDQISNYLKNITLENLINEQTEIDLATTNN